MLKPHYVLLLIIFLASGLRFARLDAYAPYVDEKFTCMTTQGVCVGGANQQELFNKNIFTPKEFWKTKKVWDYLESNARCDIGTHIVYVFILKAWSGCFGMSDFSMRTPSVLLAILTILLLYRFVKENFKSENIALISAFILAVEPLHIALSMQARSYSLSIFLTLFGTYLFSKIVNSNGISMSDKKLLLTHHSSLIIAYTLVFSASLLNHYMNGVVFLGHGLYVLFFVRDWSKWLKLGFAATVSGFCLFAWLTWGGGQWTFEFLVEKNRVLAETAKIGTMAGMTDVPSAKNLLKYMYKIFLDLFITTNDLHRALFNFKSFSLAVQSVLSLLVLLVNVGLIVSFLKKWNQIEAPQKRLYCLFLFIAIFPQIFLVYDALKNGHTGNITQRYSAFAMPYLAVIVATLLLEIQYQKKYVKYIFIGILLIQAFFVGRTITNILADKAPKYTTRYGEPRAKNPYKQTADKIISTYQIGDTVVYPSYGLNVFSPVNKDADKISILDAQYTNIYLPKNAMYIQRINKDEANKVIIKNGNRKIEVFDFQGDKYRY